MTIAEELRERARVLREEPLALIYPRLSEKATEALVAKYGDSWQYQCPDVPEVCAALIACAETLEERA